MTARRPMKRAKRAVADAKRRAANIVRGVVGRRVQGEGEGEGTEAGQRLEIVGVQQRLKYSRAAGVPRLAEHRVAVRSQDRVQQTRCVTSSDKV
jgi:hypothetical protein